MALEVKNPPANAGDRRDAVWSLGQENPLISQEEEMETFSSILAWNIPRTERSLAGYSPWGHTESDTTKASYHSHTQVNSCYN